MKKPTVFIGGSDVVDTTSAFTGAGFTSGEIGFFVKSTLANTGASISSSENPFFIAKKASPTAVSQFGTKKFSDQSPVINAYSITRLERVNYSPPLAQVTFLGFDGTESELTYNCDTTYGIRFVGYSPYIRKFYNNQGLPFTWHITTECCADDCSADCGEADCLLESAKFVKAINDEFVTNRFVGAELSFNGSASDVGTGLASTTATLTAGSAIVTFGAAVTIADGAYLRIAADNVVNTGDDDPVYKVLTGVTAGTTITLDTPWQNASVSALTVTATVATSAMSIVDTTAVTKCGIRFTGKYIDPYTGCCCFPPFPLDYEMVSFTISDSLEASWPCSFTTNTTQEVFGGRGTARELVYTEMNAFGYNDIRQWFIDCASNIGYSSAVDSSTNYDTFYIEHSTSYPTTPMGGNIDNTPYIEIIAVPTGSNSATAIASVMTSLSTLTGVPYTTLS